MNVTKILFKAAPTRTVGIFATTRNNIQTTINSMKDDLTKIIEYNKMTRANSKFVVVDKAKSKATLYNGDKVVNTFDIGVGENIGDTLNDVSYDYATKTFSKTGRTTPSGEFKTAKLPNQCENKADYESSGELNVVLLNGVMHPANYRQNTSLALHQLPNQFYDQRMHIMNTIKGRKGMSTGCVNFRKEDFQALVKDLPEGTPVYILPEETGNRLILTELPNGDMWFKTQYSDEKRANALELAIKNYFNIP